MNIRGRNKVTPEFNMSSMTDIVFLLLVFFMIASTLVSANAIDLLLPKSGGKTTQSKSLSVSITKDLDYYVDREKVAKNKLEAYILSKIGLYNGYIYVVSAVFILIINDGQVYHDGVGTYSYLVTMSKIVITI